MQALLRLPDGSAAAGVPLHIKVSTSEKPWQGHTDQQGAVSTVFNIPSVDSITVEVSIELNEKEPLIPPLNQLTPTLWLHQVSAEGVQQRKVFDRAKSPSNSYLYISYSNKIYSVGDHLTIDYNTINPPTKGFIYYMVRPVWNNPIFTFVEGKNAFQPIFFIGSQPWSPDKARLSQTRPLSPRHSADNGGSGAILSFDSLLLRPAWQRHC